MSVQRLRKRGLVAGVLFPCPAPSYSIDNFPGELIWVPKGPVVDLEPNAEGTQAPCDSVPCLLLPYESARFLILFFHSNAEDIGRCRWFCQFLRDQFQVHVLSVEYPGYGVCPGPTTCEGVIANALAALQFVTQVLQIPLENVKVFGRSIGTGPAVQLASRFKLAGVILVTPFLSVKALFRDKIGFLSNFVEEWFANDEAVPQIKSPTMIIHGRRDRLIPYSHAEGLYNACVARKLLINPVAMEHNTNLTSDVSYLIVPMFRFFSLPDYSFQELKVPSWAYDKRRSPFYIRPDIQVSSHLSATSAGGSGLSSLVGCIGVPMGDDADVSVSLGVNGADADKDGKRRNRRVVGSSGDTPPVDYERLAVLIHPTVLHTYSATKARYAFEDPAYPGGKAISGVFGGEEEHTALAMDGLSPEGDLPLDDEDNADFLDEDLSDTEMPSLALTPSENALKPHTSPLIHGALLPWRQQLGVVGDHPPRGGGSSVPAEPGGEQLEPAPLDASCFKSDRSTIKCAAVIPMGASRG